MSGINTEYSYLPSKKSMSFNWGKKKSKAPQKNAKDSSDNYFKDKVTLSDNAKNQNEITFKSPSGSGNSTIIGTPGKDKGETLIKYVCSEGSVEYHTAKDSKEGVKAHEEEHIREYEEIAQKHNIKVADPQISVYEEYCPELGINISTGGRAKCHFTAEVEGQNINVPVSKDGHILDSNIEKILKKRDTAK